MSIVGKHFEPAKRKCLLSSGPEFRSLEPTEKAVKGWVGSMSAALAQGGVDTRGSLELVSQLPRKDWVSKVKQRAINY